MPRPHPRFLSIFAIALAAGTAAYAATNLPARQNDASAINQARITLVQAVAAAEQHAHGRAARAEFEHTASGWVYDVEVVGAAKVFDVRVDAGNGAVLSSAEDQADHDDGNDKED